MPWPPCQGFLPRKTDSMAEQDTPVFQIQRVYLKDLSLEQPEKKEN